MFSLQRQIFSEGDQRLLAVAHVLKPGKKEKRGRQTLLCVTVRDGSVVLHKVKGVDDAYALRRSWPLNTVTALDAVSASSLEFSFVTEGEKTPFKWIAVSLQEKTAFLSSLQALATKHAQQHQTAFLNVHLPDADIGTGAAGGVADGLAAVDGGGGAAADGTRAAEAADSERVLTAEEEHAVEALLAEEHVTDAETYIDDTRAVLQELETENIVALLNCKAEVDSLMAKINVALDELEVIDKTLGEYDDILKPIRRDASRIAEQEKLVRVQNNNSVKLVKNLKSLVSFADLPARMIQALQEADLFRPEQVQLCSRAVAMAMQKRQVIVDAGWSDLDAVKSSTTVVSDVLDACATRLAKTFPLIVEQQVESEGSFKDVLEQKQALEPYSDMLSWLQNMDAPSNFSRFNTALQAYNASFGPVYLKEVRALCASFKIPFSSKVRDKAATLLSRRIQFHDDFGRLVGKLVPMILREQEFSCALFGLEAAGDESCGEPHHPTAFDHMSELLPGLSEELASVVQFGHKLDAFNSVTMLVVMDSFTESSSKESTYVLKLLGHGILCAKRLHDKHMDQWQRSLLLAKTPKKPGILPCVQDYAEFVKHTEEVSGKAKRRSIIDKTYMKITQTVFDTISRIARESKYPDVVQFENYNRIYDQLAHFHIQSLNTFVPHAKEMYRRHQNLYVQSALGRPMERLSTFFEGVQRLVASGMAPNDVRYQFEFSKQNLLECIKLYPGKEVKRGLEATYRRIEKQCSSHLLIVVWRNVQDQFVKLYQEYEKLIADCYPGSNIKLQFDVPDLLSYFTSIAER